MPDLGLYGYYTSGTIELRASSDGLAVSQALTDTTVVASRDDSSPAMRRRRRGAQASSTRRPSHAVPRRPRSARARPARSRRERKAVLEPYAFGELLWYFGLSSLGALALLEGRSYLGDGSASRRSTRRSRSPTMRLDPRGLPKAFDLEGGQQRVPIVEAGVARDVVWDRRTAARAGRKSTGHALQPGSQAHGPIPFNLSVPGGDATMDDLAERVGDGLYVTRLHYVNIVDAREGLHRDDA